MYERAWFRHHDGAIRPSSVLNLRRGGLDPFALTLWHHDCLQGEPAPLSR